MGEIKLSVLGDVFHAYDLLTNFIISSCISVFCLNFIILLNATCRDTGGFLQAT